MKGKIMRRIFCAFAIFVVVSPLIRGFEVPPEWKVYLQKVVDNFMRSPSCATVFPPLIPSLSNDDPHLNPGTHFLPPVIVWDPYLSFTSMLSVCVECSKPIERRAWKLGQSPALQPRIIHDIQSTIVLVSSLYICSDDHSFLTTDPRVLERIPNEYIPFILLHKTGFLKTFLNFIIGLVGQGLTFSAIEQFVHEQRRITIANKRLKMAKVLSLPGHNFDQYKSLSLLGTPYPSNDIICKCFIAEYVINQQKYNHAMSEIHAESTVSFDHTFKVAANIGYLRSDGKWVAQYDSVFFVMNQCGQIMAWQFTRSTSMDEVKKLLDGVKKRTKDVDNLLVVADNCCSVKRKIAEVFGNDVIVKLDLFHAVQRISRKMSKRHPLYSLCINDLRLVFRQAKDFGQKRQFTTPSSRQILDNLDAFVKKWKLCTFNEWKIINENVVKEIECLKLHITKGCLSDIPVGVGTNRNERLHRHLKPHFSRTRLGLPVALALMTLLLYIYNHKITGKEGVANVLLENSTSESTSDYAFGIIDKEVSNQGLWGMQKLGNTSEQDLTQVTKSVILDECVSQIATIQELTIILENAFHLFKVTKMIDSKVDSSASFLNYRFFPFMSSVSSLFFSRLQSDTEQQTSSYCPSKMDDIIGSWKMKRHLIEGDGNCCFVAVAVGLQHLAENTPSFHSHQLNMDLKCTQNLSRQLRQATVKEWKENSEHYSGFLVEGNIAEEADKFQQLGFYDSDLGDSLLLALSNILGMQIIVFTTLDCHPIVHVTPRDVRYNTVLYLAYTHIGSGHYDAVTPEQSNKTSPDSSTAEITGKCTCGKNKSDQDEMSHCVPIKTKYATVTRCWCLKNGKQCTSQCRCKNCCNEYGERPQHESGPSRKRRRYAHQISVEKSAMFGYKMGENLCPGSRSKLEFFVFEGVLQFLKSQPHEHGDIISNINTLYNAIVDIADCSDQKLPIGKKSTEDVKTFLREHQHNLELFVTLCHAQLKAFENT